MDGIFVELGDDVLAEYFDHLHGLVVGVALVGGTEAHLIASNVLVGHDLFAYFFGVPAEHETTFDGHVEHFVVEYVSLSRTFGQTTASGLLGIESWYMLTMVTR